MNHSPSSGSSRDSLQQRIGALVERDFAAQCAFLAELVKVPTDNPPGDCAPHAAVAQRLLEAMGFTVDAYPVPQSEVQAVGMISATNLVVRRQFSNTGPCIALNAHGDVVPPGLGWSKAPYGAEVVDNGPGPSMYGRGVAVSKSDFATYAYALRVLDTLSAEGHRLHGSVELHLTYDEEVGGDIGPRRLLQQHVSKPDYAICAGFSYAVTSAHNGCLHLEVTVLGQQAHAAMPETGVDALAATTGILQSLYASREALKSQHSATPGITHPTLNVGLISGGINTNVVPDRIIFRIDRRMIPEESPPQVEAALRASIEQTAATYPGIRIDIRRILLALPLPRLPGAEKLISALQRHGQAWFGVPIAEHGVPLYTDARHYTAAGIPTVLYGAGPRTLLEAHGHAADEHLLLADLKRATATIAATLVELLSMANET